MVIGSRVVDGKRLIGRGSCRGGGVLAAQPQLLDRFQQTSVPKCLLVHLEAPFCSLCPKEASHSPLASVVYVNLSKSVLKDSCSDRIFN